MDPLADKHILIASYAHIADGKYTTLGGPALALKNYLKGKAGRLLCIWQPVPISDTISAIAESFVRGAKLKDKRFYVLDWPFGRKKEISFIYVALKLRDILATLYFALISGRQWDIFVGVEAVNALVGVFLRGCGMVKTVVYYNLDFGEKRFANRILNSIFHFLDARATKRSDYTWNLTPEMIEARAHKGIVKKGDAGQMIVPIGIDLSRITLLPLEQIERKTICYLGILAEKQGVRLLIEAMPEILKLDSEVRLMVVGSGPLENEMKEKAAALQLGDRLTFAGLVSDEEAERILCRCAIGIAPYLPDPYSTKLGSDPTKPKMYLACGLPTIITRVPPIAEEIEKRRAGFAIAYDAQELARAVARLTSDGRLYREFRQNAIEYAKSFDWTHIWDATFQEMLKEMTP